MKYKSELIKDIVDTRGHEKSSLHYESECIETWIDEANGAYPKLTDYRSEWLNYIVSNSIGEFPYITLSNVTNATVENVVPYAYKSAILKGQTLVNVNRSNYTTNTNITDDYGQAIDFYDADMLPNTTYTIIMYSDNLYECRFSQLYDDREYNLAVVKVGTPFVFTTVKNYQGLRSYLKGDELNIPQGTEIKILIIEGDYTNIDIPYFEGMQSVKMPVLTTSNEDGTKTNILTVNEDVTLRGVGDVKDELDLLTGKLTQRIDEDGEILTQEVVKTVDLTVTEQDGNTKSIIRPIEGTMHLSTSGETIKPTFSGEIPVEAITQNLASFIEEWEYE